MLEGLVADVLGRLLRQYVRGIDRDGIRFGVWSGELELRELELVPEALAMLLESASVDLPVDVRVGRVSLLRVVVPWKRLRKEAVRVEVDGVTVVAGAGGGLERDGGLRKEERLKRGVLSTDEAIRAAKWTASGEEGGEKRRAGGTNAGGGPAGGNVLGTAVPLWISRILQNVRVEVKNVIVRFVHQLDDNDEGTVDSCAPKKDASSVQNKGGSSPGPQNIRNSNRSFLATLCADRLLLSTLEGSDGVGTGIGIVPGVMAGAGMALRKVVAVERISIGWEPIDREESDDAVSLAQTVRPISRHILEPLSASLYIALNLHNDPSTPKARCSLKLDGVNVALDEFQYETMLRMAMWCVHHQKKSLSERSPRERWLWAIDRLVPGFHERLNMARRFNAKGIRAAREAFVEYVSLRKQVVRALLITLEGPRASAMRRLEALEDELPLADIINYRNYVDDELQMELRKRREQQENVQKNQIWSFFSRMRSDRVPPNKEASAAPVTQMRPTETSQPTATVLLTDRNPLQRSDYEVPNAIGSVDVVAASAESSVYNPSPSIQIPGSADSSGDEMRAIPSSAPTRLSNTGAKLSSSRSHPSPTLHDGSGTSDSDNTYKSGGNPIMSKQIPTTFRAERLAGIGRSTEATSSSSATATTNNTSKASFTPSNAPASISVHAYNDSEPPSVRISLHLVRGTVTLKLGGIGAQPLQPLSRMTLQSLRIGLETRPQHNGFRFDAVLGNVQLLDLRTEVSLPCPNSSPCPKKR